MLVSGHCVSWDWLCGAVSCWYLRRDRHSASMSAWGDRCRTYLEHFGADVGFIFQISPTISKYFQTLRFLWSDVMCSRSFQMCGLACVYQLADSERDLGRQMRQEKREKGAPLVLHCRVFECFCNSNQSGHEWKWGQWKCNLSTSAATYLDS